MLREVSAVPVNRWALAMPPSANRRCRSPTPGQWPGRPTLQPASRHQFFGSFFLHPRAGSGGTRDTPRYRPPLASGKTTLARDGAGALGSLGGRKSSLSGRRIRTFHLPRDPAALQPPRAMPRREAFRRFPHISLMLWCFLLAGSASSEFSVIKLAWAIR